MSQSEVLFRHSVGGIALEHIKYRNIHGRQERSFHDEYEIVYIVKGKHLLFMNNRTYVVNAGDIIIIDSDVIHMPHCADNSNEEHERMAFYITSKKMKEYDSKFPGLELVNYFKMHSGTYHLTDEHKEQFLRLSGLFQKECKGKQFGFGQLLETAVLSSLVKMVRELNVSEPVEPVLPTEIKVRRTYRIAEYMSKNVDSISTLDVLAKTFHVSKFYMCRVFKEITGCTMLEYLIALRIQSARRYLENSDMSISEISAKVGYNSLTHFEKEFKRNMNISPLKYRKTKDRSSCFNITHVFPHTEECGYFNVRDGHSDCISQREPVETKL